MFYMERISYVGGILEIFESKYNNQDIFIFLIILQATTFCTSPHCCQSYQVSQELWMKLMCLPVALSSQFGMMALANLLRIGGQHQVPGRLLPMLEHETDLFLGQV